MRTQLTTNNATTYYLYDDEAGGGVPVVELAYASGNATTSLQYLNGTCADGWRLRYVGGVAYVETYDPQGSIVQSGQDLAAGQTQYARATYCYDGFGGLRGRWSSAGSTSNVHQDPAGFGGQYGYYQDLQTGLEHLGARYYDGGTGRFVTRDPIGYNGGENLYAFCRNNPITGSDPNGTAAAAVLGAGLRILPNLVPAAGRVALGTVLAPLADVVTIVGGIEATRELYIYGTTGHIAGPIVGQGAEWGSQLGTALYPTTSAAITVSQVEARFRTRPFAENAKLNSNIIEQMYRGNWVNGQWVSSDGYLGGLAGAISRERATGEHVGGKTHTTKGLTTLRALNRILTSGEFDGEALSEHDLNIVRGLRGDIQQAFKVKKNE